MKNGETEVLDRKESGHEDHDRKKEHPDKNAEIKVNKKPVTMTIGKHTGLEIKQAAIAQGVQIDLDFVLSVIIGQKKTEIVSDDEKVQIHKGSCFTAVADDDNS